MSGKRAIASSLEHVVAAVDPVRHAPGLLEAADDVVVVDLHEPELRLGLCDRDRRERATGTMCGEQRAEVDVDELVAVQRQDVAALLPPLRRELDPAAAPEPLRLLDGDDLGPSPASSVDERRSLAGRAREDDARHAGVREAAHLVGGERLARDVDERLRASCGSVAEPLGLAAGEDDRLHGCPRSWRPDAGDCGTVSGGAAVRPMPS